MPVAIVLYRPVEGAPSLELVSPRTAAVPQDQDADRGYQSAHRDHHQPSCRKEGTPTSRQRPGRPHALHFCSILITGDTTNLSDHSAYDVRPPIGAITYGHDRGHIYQQIKDGQVPDDVEGGAYQAHSQKLHCGHRYQKEEKL